jgi:hypothetical protein
MQTSARRSLSYPNPTTRADSADVPRDIKTLIDALELDVVFSQGTHAARPAAGAGVPAGTGGGRLYWETDTAQLFYDSGSAWIGPINSVAPGTASITTAMLQDDAVTAIKIAAGAVGASEIADGTISVTELAASLVPSQGAGGGAEALRALGTAAGMAAAGVHASQHAPLGADPFTTRTGVRLSQTGQSIPDSTLTVLAFSTENWDSNSLHDVAVNNSRITIPTGLGGIWKVWANVTFANPAEDGLIAVVIRKNGATQVGGGGSPAFIFGANVEIEDLAVAGDYYEVLAYQHHSPSPASLATVAPTYFGARFQSA